MAVTEYTRKRAPNRPLLESGPPSARAWRRPGSRSSVEAADRSPARGRRAPPMRENLAGGYGERSYFSNGRPESFSARQPPSNEMALV